MNVDNTAKKYADQGLVTWFIMVANPMGNTPTKGDCKVFRAQQGIKSRVLFDPTLVTQEYGNKETFWVTNSAAEITYKALKLDISAIETEVIKALQPQ